MKSSKIGLLILSAAIFLLVLPAVALACPNCYKSTNAQVLNAYYTSALFLSSLPLGFIAMAFLVLRQKTRRTHK